MEEKDLKLLYKNSFKIVEVAKLLVKALLQIRQEIKLRGDEITSQIKLKPLMQTSYFYFYKRKLYNFKEYLNKNAKVICVAGFSQPPIKGDVSAPYSPP